MDNVAQSFHPAVCPHCGKEFEAELLVDPSTPESRGFKCPHCRLFVPAERAKDPDET